MSVCRACDEGARARLVDHLLDQWLIFTILENRAEQRRDEETPFPSPGPTDPITGFDESKSVCKTLRKPAEQLKEFKGAGKVALRKFLEDINAVDTKMNGRINEEIVLLKVS